MKVLLLSLLAILALSGQLVAQCVSVKNSAAWGGATVYGNGVNDDAAAIQAIADQSAGKCVTFPAGTYMIGQKVRWNKNKVAIVGEDLVTVKSVSNNFTHDGFIIGNNGAPEGTATAIGTFDVSIKNFNFVGVRAAVWVVYSQRVKVANISADGTAVVALGNDNNSGSEDVTINNIERTGPGPGLGVWYTLGVLRSKNVQVTGVRHFVPIPKNAIAIDGSERVSLTEIYIRQNSGTGPVAGIGACVDFHNARYSQISNFQLQGCFEGIIFFYSPGLPREQFNTADNGTITQSLFGVSFYSSHNTVRNLTMTDQAYSRVDGTLFPERSGIYYHTDGRYNYVGNVKIPGVIKNCWGEQAPGVRDTGTWVDTVCPDLVVAPLPVWP
jgi:hypothetical protein